MVLEAQSPCLLVVSFLLWPSYACDRASSYAFAVAASAAAVLESVIIVQSSTIDQSSGGDQLQPHPPSMSVARHATGVYLLHSQAQQMRSIDAASRNHPSQRTSPRSA